MKIRRGKKSDLDILLAFEQDLISLERPLDPSLRQTGEIFYYDIAALLASENALVLIAEAEGEAVGSGFVRIEENDPKFRRDRMGYIGLIYVKDEFRRRGIAGEIIRGLTKWLSERGIQEASLRVYSENTNAVRAYEKFGFRSGLLEMKLDL